MYGLGIGEVRDFQHQSQLEFQIFKQTIICQTKSKTPH